MQGLKGGNNLFHNICVIRTNDCTVHRCCARTSPKEIERERKEDWRQITSEQATSVVPKGYVGSVVGSRQDAKLQMMRKCLMCKSSDDWTIKGDLCDIVYVFCVIVFIVK